MTIVSSSAVASPFATYGGTWGGSGRVTLAGGSSEAIRCRAYYSVKSSGRELGLAIRCASASYSIELRSQLKQSGGSVSGSWVERTFNASGNVVGSASASALNLTISGGVAGSMSIRVSGRTQSVSIRTSTTQLRGVDINLSRS
ncbi:MAG: hypothetical protein ACFCUN_05350 [Hyphomicrobiaceae bacterium]